MFGELSSDGQLNGTTPVTIVAAPGTGVRRIVKTIHIQNSDTDALNLVLWVRNGASDRILFDGILYRYDTLQVGDSGEIIILDSTDKSIMAKTTTPAASQDLYFVAAYADASGCEY